MIRRVAQLSHPPQGLRSVLCWWSWVECLAARFRWRGWQRPGLRMMWVSPHLLLTQVCHHSQQFFWAVFSHIRLALMKSSPPSSKSKALRPTGTLTSLGARSLLQPERPSRGMTLVAEQRSPGPRLSETSRPVPATDSFQRLLPPRRTPVEAGVKLRFARTAAAAQSAVSLEESLRIVRRVVEERQRVEVRVPGRAVVQHSAKTPRVTHSGHAPTPDRFAPVPTPAWQTAARSGFPSPPAPLISIERLADQVIRQIDDRMTAYRERTGKLF